VQAGVSGLEIEPSMILPQVVKELDPAAISGTLVMVPLLNTSGFEFEQVKAIWDDKNLNALGRGKADGTVSEQMIHTYYEQVISKADAMVDIHTGSKWSYHRYAGVFGVGDVEKSRDLALSLGLPHVLLGQTEDQSMAFEAAKDGKAVATAWIGGGPGLRDFREEDMERSRQAVLNTMKHLGMLEGEPEGEGAELIQQHTVINLTGERGLTFMDKSKRGQTVEVGEELGYVRHPFTGEVLSRITAPKAGVVIYGGASWPVVPEGVTLAILGDRVE
jgi:predicted deacylase